MEHKIKFCIELHDNMTETFNKLIQGYRDQAQAQALSFRWHKAISDQWMTPSGWPVTSQIYKDISNLRINTDHQLVYTPATSPVDR